MLRLLIVAIVSTFLLIPIVGFLGNFIKNEILLIVVSFTAGYVIVPAILLKLWPERQSANDSDSLERALEKGLIEAREYSVLEAVEIAELEDEGLHYLLSISPARTLSLSGQYLYSYSELPNFPSATMRFFVHTKSNLCYGIECIGNRLDNVTRIKPASSEAWKAEIVPDDMEIVERPISEVVSQIQTYAR